MVLANPSIGQFAGFKKPQVWNFLHEATHDTSGPVCGLIVYHQDFGNSPLVRERRNAGRDDRLLVPGGNNNCNGAYGWFRDESFGGACMVIDAGHGFFWMRKGRFPTAED